MKKRYFSFLIGLVFLSMFSGCLLSNIDTDEQVLANTLWVSAEDDRIGYIFTENNEYALWKIVDTTEGKGDVIWGAYNKYQIQKNEIIFLI